MAKMYWPPEQTFKYEFNSELDLEIPLNENKTLEGKKTQKDESR